MLIRDDIENLPIEQEEQHIVKLLNKYIKKINCDTLFYYNNSTVEDLVFYYFFKKNANKINAQLLYYGDEVEAPEEGLKIVHLSWLDNAQIKKIIADILTSSKVAIVNTKTLISERVEQKPISANIDMFVDYSWNYMQQLITYYNIPEHMLKQYDITEEERKLLEDYLHGAKLYEKYTRDEIRHFITKYGKKNNIKKATIFNSLTYNFMEEVQHLE